VDTYFKKTQLPHELTSDVREWLKLKELFFSGTKNTLPESAPKIAQFIMHASRYGMQVKKTDLDSLFDKVVAEERKKTTDPVKAYLKGGRLLETKLETLKQKSKLMGDDPNLDELERRIEDLPLIVLQDMVNRAKGLPEGHEDKDFVTLLHNAHKRDGELTNADQELLKAWVEGALYKTKNLKQGDMDFNTIQGLYIYQYGGSVADKHALRYLVVRGKNVLASRGDLVLPDSELEKRRRYMLLTYVIANQESKNIFQGVKVEPNPSFVKMVLAHTPLQSVKASGAGIGPNKQKDATIVAPSKRIDVDLF
jgi:hypothetical protein